ncbi:DUF927 domain-containing protein [Methylobacterium durans]|uniref:DUF927 domain-containing protein n=1 Tax=Methylobacterium durans TaxID=2202825 RepID=UPI002AFDD932|nr:DUF927 domain-containing protein [Methylobacterium durans]MEA1831275.1 DUF927 domain-containing protein [Methylobacterium durans]
MPILVQASRRARRDATDSANAPVTAVKVRKENDLTLHYLFTIRLDGGRKHRVLVSQIEPLGNIAKVVGSVSEDIPRAPAEAKSRIEEILAAAPAETFIGVEQPGFKNGTAFIADGIRRGHEYNRYLWLTPSACSTPQAAGSFSGWQECVALPCRESSYLAFALMTGLAGPLLHWANLPEGAAFHLYGDSSTGKSTTARVAASITGAPGNHSNWGRSARRLTETAAEHRDQALILDAAEKAKRQDVKEILQAITHGLVEGGGKVYAASVQASLPDLTSRSPILSNGNRSGAELARIAGLPWDEQEAARFISIPVPKRAQGGVIDLPSSTDPHHSAHLINMLEKGLKRHHGRVLGRWLTLVWKHRERVNGLIANFVSLAQPNDAYERRIARKFGLIYAAGMIGVRTGFLPWEAGLPNEVVLKLYHGARAAMQVGCAREAIVALAEALNDAAMFPDIGTAKELILDHDAAMVGFRFSKAGDEFVAIRQDGLGALLDKTAEPEALISALAEAGVIELGHGGRRGKQLHVQLINRANGRIIVKPRCLVMKAAPLAAFIEAAGRGRRGDDDAIVVV